MRACGLKYLKRSENHDDKNHRIMNIYFKPFKAYLKTDELSAVFSFIQSLQDEDDEPLSEDEIAQIEASRRDIESGNVYTIEEVEEYLREKPCHSG
jgi:hypothetical protein